MTDPLPVYLVHYNAPEWVRSACDSILRSDIPVALTIVDNSGNLTGPDSRVRVIRPEKNTGYAGGANVAIRDWLTSNSDFCVIGSHDLHLDEAALRLMMEAMRAQPALGILGPKLGRDGTLPEPEFGLEEVQWVSGTCLMMRRACIAQVGPLDERYISYAEDFDLCVRAGDHGWRVGWYGRRSDTDSVPRMAVKPPGDWRTLCCSTSSVTDTSLDSEPSGESKFVHSKTFFGETFGISPPLR